MKSLKVDLKKLSPEAICRIIEAAQNEPGGNIIAYTAPPAPVVPKIDRKAICNKVHWLCARSPGATFYNAAEYALDEVIELMAPPAPAVPDCLQRLLKHAEGLTFGSDWNNGTAAKYHRDALIQAVKDCRAAMLNQADTAAEPKSELAQRASKILADATELANRISDQVGNEYQQFASLAGAEKRNIGIKDLVSSEIADFFAGDATKFVDGKPAAEMQKEIMKRIATCFYAE